MKKLAGVGCRATFQESGEKGNGNVHKGRSSFFAIFRNTYLPMSSTLFTIFYVLCPIFLDIPTYPKIGHS
mgnify:CR=1 FL=1